MGPADPLSPVRSWASPGDGASLTLHRLFMRLHVRLLRWTKYCLICEICPAPKVLCFPLPAHMAFYISIDHSFQWFERKSIHANTFSLRLWVAGSMTLFSLPSLHSIGEGRPTQGVGGAYALGLSGRGAGSPRAQLLPCKRRIELDFAVSCTEWLVARGALLPLGFR